MPFVIYRSSAGSGKTSTLVKEYLKLALCEEDRFRHILAVTFTNKAAEEMKTRIISALRNISEKNSDEASIRLLAELKNETGLPVEQIIISSGRVLQNILHNYSDFSVSTIDSFVHNIVRSFARDLRLAWNFEVETNELALLSEAVNVLINSVDEDETLTRALIEFAESQTEDEKSWNIEIPLNELAQSLLNDESIDHLARLKNLKPEDFERIRTRLLNFTRRIQSQINEIAYKAMKLIDENGLSDKDFYQTNKGIVNYFRKLESDFETDELLPNRYVTETIRDDKWYKKQTLASIQIRINSIKSQLTGYFHSIQKIIELKLSDYAVSVLILKRIFALSVLNRIDDLLNNIKLEKNIVLISEFNKRVHEVVTQESIPFIFERIGEKYEHYLIDEFQDTSLLQWSNLLPLVDNVLASDQFNMVVGDGKQAIYRFRNGDVEQFNNLPKIYKAGDDPFVLEREASLERHCVEKYLAVNFRSAKNIVDFNNDLFQCLRQLPELKNKKIYEDVVQVDNPINMGGYITFDFIEQDEENEFNQNVLDKTLELIHSLLDEGFSRNEIAILTRFNKDASAIAGYLMEKGISVVSAESVLIYRSPEVRFIISVFQYLADPANTIAKAEMLRYLHQKNKTVADELHDTFTSVHQSDIFLKKSNLLDTIRI